MSNCLVCNSNSKGDLCRVCAKDPFRVEDYRHRLATDYNLDRLKSTYNLRFTEIKNLNTAEFWDKKLSKIQSLSQQDGMTQDRIKYTAEYLGRGKKRLLDLGAGYGYIEEILAKNNDIKFSAVDISPEAVRLLNKRFKGDFSVCSIYKYKYKRSKFDAVVLLEVLEHVPPSKTFFILDNINKVLKLNGIFILSVPLNEGLEQMKKNKNGHLRTYTKNVIITELKLAGFEVLEYKELYAFKNMYSLKTLLSKVFKNKWRPNNIVIKARKI